MLSCCAAASAVTTASQAKLPPELAALLEARSTPPPGEIVVDAERPHVALDTALALPLGYRPCGAEPEGGIAVLLHLFYDELAPEIFGYLQNLPFAADLYVTTDETAKRQRILQAFAGWHRGSVEVRLVPNRGRDIAPKVVALRDVHLRYRYVLHIHGKRSVHWEYGDAWRRFVLKCLLGSPDTVRGVFEAFAHAPRLGIVMPQHWGPVVPALSWGFDFGRARALARRIGFDLGRDQPLEFPSGSMFWARSAALRPLLDLGLSFDDFPEEGFTGGTLAHAIERLYLRVCEHSGHGWLKVAPADARDVPSRLLVAEDPSALRGALRRGACLLGDPALRSAPVPAYRPRLRFQPDDTARPRLTLLLTDMASGEVATEALSVLRALGDAAGGAADLRIVLPADAASGAEPAGFTPIPADEPGRHGAVLVRLPAIADGPPPALPVRAGEVLVTADWRTTRDALALRAMQRSWFGSCHPLLRLFVSLEPDFGAPTDAGAAAAATCREADGTVALFWSEALRDWLTRLGHVFPRHDSVRPCWDPALAPLLPGTGGPRAPLLLVDWQPSASGGLPELLRASLARWLEDDPQGTWHWHLLAVGEAGPDLPLVSGRALRRIAPLSAPDRGALLARAGAGLSLGRLPTPGTFALELAAFGVPTVLGPPAVGLRHGTDTADYGAAGFYMAAQLEAPAVAAALRHAVAAPPRPAAPGERLPPGFMSAEARAASARRLYRILFSADSRA